MDEVEQNIVICLWRADLRDTANHDILRQPSSIIVLSVDHQVCFSINIFGKLSDLPFSRKSDHKKEKGTVSFMHEQIICSQTQLDGIAHEQTIFVGSYLQVRWWALGQWKERKICFEWYLHYYSFRIFCCFWLAAISGWFFITSRHLKEERTRNNPSLDITLVAASFPGNNHFSWAEL